VTRNVCMCVAGFGSHISLECYNNNIKIIITILKLYKTMLFRRE